jgi:hypothetical protein
MALNDFLPAKPVPSELADANIEPARQGIVNRSIDWLKTKESIERSIMETSDSRDKLVTQRDGELLQAACGDRKAAGRADALDIAISDADRQLGKLRRALEKVDERIAVEITAKEAERVARNWEKVERRAADSLNVAEEVDAAAKLFSEKLDLLITLRQEMHLYAPVKDNEVLHYSAMSKFAVENAARVALRSYGVCNWATPEPPQSYPTLREVIDAQNKKLLAGKDTQ